MKKLEQEIGRIDEEVKIEMLTWKAKDQKPPEVPIIPFKDTEAPLNLLLLEHYRNELKNWFLAEDAPKQFKIVKDECIEKIKAPNLYQFRDKYLNPKMMQKVDTQRLEKISRNQFDNVELLMRALPKTSRKKLQETFENLILNPRNKKKDYEDCFETFLTSLAPNQR